MGTPARAARALSLGRAGERVAAAYLRGRGLRVIGTGFLARRGEIDLVCRDGDTIVLVEVKTRTDDSFGSGAEAVHAGKRRAMQAAAAEYRALAGWRGAIRFAVVTLLVGRDGKPAVSDYIPDPFP